MQLGAARSVARPGEYAGGSVGLVGSAGTFVVARNPDTDSSLPFLIRLPLPNEDLILKARDRWPQTAKVYCHRAQVWPDDPDIVEEVPVRSCRRRGVAIDLVLDRARQNRSQLVFTRLAGGREGIFWQSPATTRKSRPGIRVPSRRASGIAELTVLVDSRERYPYRFSGLAVGTERRALPSGDYGVALDEEIVAVVERKSLADLASSAIDGSLGYALAELCTVPRSALVVEDRYSAIFKLSHAPGAFVAELLATLQVRYTGVPIVFCESRPLAEQWTYRFLGAALAYAAAESER